MPRQDFSFIIKNVNKSICLLRFFMLQEATVRSYANCFALVPCLYLRHNECELYRTGHRCREPYLRNPTPKKKTVITFTACERLEQHGGGVLHVTLERLEPFCTDGACTQGHTQSAARYGLLTKIG